MDKLDDDFLKRLLRTFKVEAEEHLKGITSGLIDLEKVPDFKGRIDLIETIFREAHSLKGAARAVNATEIEEVCQPIESIFAALKRQEIVPSPELFDLLHRAVDTLGALLLFIEMGPAASPKPRITGLIESLAGALKGELSLPPKEEAREQEIELHSLPGANALRITPDEKQIVSETIRVSIAKLDRVLLQAEELLSAKLSMRQQATELQTIQDRLMAWEKEWTKLRPIRRALERAPLRNGEQNGEQAASHQLARMLEFLEWNQEFLQLLKVKLTGVTQAADHDQRMIGAMVDNLLNQTKEVLMLPSSALLDILPKFIRDLSRDQGKETELAASGGDVKIDRRILEEMKGPLIHLIRNCLDHGIEKPDDRAHKGKPRSGTITVAISPRDSNSIELLIADDGQGLNVAMVRAAAVRLGVISQEQAENCGDEDALLFVFQSGISTSPIITDLSGRGLGLTIVKEKVEKLGGSISIETAPDVGTTFRIILPLRLATLRGILISIDEHYFILPATNVERVMRVAQAEIKTVENRETIQVDGQAISLVGLRDVLELPQKTRPGEPANSLPVVVLTSLGNRIAFLVDEILNEQEVLEKGLGRLLLRVRNIAGATVLGDGKVVPILNVSDLIKSAVRMSATGSRTAVTTPSEIEERKKSVLVAEDSITSRALLKNILEAAGYEVETAVDGIDAFTKLRSNQFDLVVSDVDMPRMNGFGLIAKIRGDRKLASLPVILVTALGSREDREHGIDVGANAYLVKSSFDQGNLLEVIQRLI